MAIQYSANFKIVGKADPQKLSYAGAFQPVKGSLSDLADHISKGHPWMPAILDKGARRYQQNANYAEILAADVDDHMTIEQAMQHPFIAAHCGLGIESSSSTPDHHKFRLVFRLPEPITDWRVIRACNQYLIELLGTADPSCKDASRFFFGGLGRSPFLLNEAATLPADFVEQVKARAAQEERDRAERERMRQLKSEQFRQISHDEGWDLDALVNQALSFIPSRTPGSGNYQEILTVAMALNSHYGAIEAESILEAHSPSIPGTTWNVGRKIRSFKAGKGVGIGSLFYIAQKYGFKFPKAKKQNFGEPDAAAYAEYCQWEADQAAALAAQEREESIDRLLKLFSSTQEKRRHEPNQTKKVDPAREAIASADYKIARSSLPASRRGRRAVSGVVRLIGSARKQLRLSALRLERHRNRARKLLAVLRPDGKHQANPNRRLQNSARNHRNRLLAAGKQQASNRLSAQRSAGHEYAAGDRLTTWQQLVSQGKKYILDRSPTGTGKSFDSGKVEPKEFRASQVIYLSPQHRNPTVDTLLIENGWIDLEARHSGLSREVTPGGSSRLKRSPKHEIPNVPGNCNRTGIINALRAKHVQGADTASVVCGTCSFKEACQNASGSNFGFLNQRRSALSSPKLRAHPDSVPDPTEYKLDESILLWDEAGENFTTKRDVVVTMQDLQQTIAALLKVEMLKPLQALLTALLSYLDGSSKAGRYGLNHAAVVKLLGDVGAIDIEAIERALQPDLGFLNTTAEHGVELADLPASLRKKFADRDRDGAALAEQHVIKQWLPDLLRVLNGERGSLHLGTTLTISLGTDRHRSIANAAKANIFLDATLSREDLALKLNCSPNEILVIQQHVPKTENLTIIQVPDLKRLGMQRGADQQRRAEAIVAHYQALDPDVKVIDFKKFSGEGMGAWWRDTRGVNDFEQTKRLILTGTPCRNLTDLQAEYAILTGDQNPDSDGSKAFVRRAILADFHQAFGRLRAHRRPDEQLEVILLSDFEIDIPTEKVSAIDICPEAGSKNERVVLAARRAIEYLKAAGQKITQGAIASIVGCTQSTISKLWKFITFAIRVSYSKSDNSIPPPDPDIVQIIENVALNAKPEEILASLPEMLFDFVQPCQWTPLWEKLSQKAQIKLLEAAFLAVPEQLARIEAIEQLD